MYIMGVFTVFVIILYLWTNKSGRVLQTKEQQPFSVNLKRAEIVEDESEGQSRKRLLLEVSIINQSAENYPNTEYVLKLNEEVRPFISSQILEFHQEKRDIYSLEECMASDEKGIKQLDGKPMTYAFNHSWSMLLTTEDDLKTYYELESAEIYSALKNMEVEIYWDGGNQREILEIKLEKSGKESVTNY